MSEDCSSHFTQIQGETQHRQINPATTMLRWHSYHRKQTASLQQRTRLYPQLSSTSTFLGAHRSQVSNSHWTAVEFAQTPLGSTKSLTLQKAYGFHSHSRDTQASSLWLTDMRLSCFQTVNSAHTKAIIQIWDLWDILSFIYTSPSTVRHAESLNVSSSANSQRSWPHAARQNAPQ